MKGCNILTILLLLQVQCAMAQRMGTREANIRFFSKAALENIDAYNTRGACLVDLNTGAVETAVLIKGFVFKKAMMQQHFNESYLESDKYPKAVFKGKVVAPTLPLKLEGQQEWTLAGTMEMHGVTKEMSIKVQLETKDGNTTVASTFPIALKDFNISVPSIVKNNIAQVVDVSISIISLKPM
ncbi:MAG TPA: YceI family protein [Phnomibacter sp.]|nr:YceI family protein [Phnomibacter sp.]